MNRRVFEDSVQQLSNHIVQEIGVFFGKRGISFNPAQFEELSSIDVDYLAREAHFFGSNCYPEDDVSLVA